MPEFFEGGTNALVSKMAFAKLSEDLMASPSARSEFTADPDAYVAKLYGVRPEDKDRAFIENLKDLVAGGLCCQGCGCLAPDAISRVVNPALVLHVAQPQ